MLFVRKQGRLWPPCSNKRHHTHFGSPSLQSLGSNGGDPPKRQPSTSTTNTRRSHQAAELQALNAARRFLHTSEKKLSNDATH